MGFLEKDLEDIIYYSDKEYLRSKGLNMYGKLFRQVRIGRYGVADLIEVTRDYNDYYMSQGIIHPYLTVTIYELKKDKINVDAFLQAVGYLKGIKSYLKKRNIKCEDYFIKLIGSGIETNSNFCFLSDLMPSAGGYDFLENYTYAFNDDNIEFTKCSNYKLNNEGF